MPYSPMFLELLEVRKFLSTVSITNFGAKPNDGNGDSTAITAAINSTKPGDTIYFPSGTYNIDKSIFLAGDRKYLGSKLTTLKSDPSVTTFEVHHDNISIKYFKFDGNPIFIDKPNNQMVENLLIDNNTFDANANSQNNDNAITFTTGLRNSSITNNNFEKLNVDNGVFGYSWDNLRIANNNFMNGNEGIHVTAHLVSSSDLTIEQNYFSGLHRMGIEDQGGGIDTLIQDNYYENPIMTGNRSDNDETFAYSIVADRSQKAVIRRNTAIAPDRPDGWGVRIIFELGGANLDCYDNYSYGGNQVVAINGVGSTGKVHDNKFSNYLQGVGDNNGSTASIWANDGGTKLSWDVNRGKPGPNKDVTEPQDDQVDAPKSTNTTKPVVAASPVIKTAGTAVFLSDLSATSTENAWGPVEFDSTSGGKKANDGGTITIANKRYNKGIGVSGDSTVAYNLAGKYTKFIAAVGIDDDTDGEGSAVFKIFADGKKIYDSGTMDGGDDPDLVNLNVSGVKTLKLVTTDAGDGDRNDHADWASARLSPLASVKALSVSHK